MSLNLAMLWSIQQGTKSLKTISPHHTVRSAERAERKGNMTQKEMMQAMMEQMNAMAARIEQLEKGAHKGAPKPEKDQVQFVKKDGTVRMCSQAQADAWNKWRDGAGDRKEKFEAMKAGWADKKAAYKPDKALTDAIKANRAAITHKIAKEKYGFVGTKQDLKALKESICNK